MVSVSADEKRYLREVERHFLKRRGSPLLVSPRDWALVMSWFEQGIPLSLVIAGIDEVFDRREERGTPHRVRSLSLCRPAVEDLWEDRGSRLAAGRAFSGDSDGGGNAGSGAEERQRLADALRAEVLKLRRAVAVLGEKGAERFQGISLELEGIAEDLLRGAGLPTAGRASGCRGRAGESCVEEAPAAPGEAIRARRSGAGETGRSGGERRNSRGETGRTRSRGGRAGGRRRSRKQAAEAHRAIESRLVQADQEIGAILLGESSESDLAAARQQALERLASHRKHMSSSIYDQTLARAVENRLRDRHGLRRLSLLLLLE